MTINTDSLSDLDSNPGANEPDDMKELVVDSQGYAYVMTRVYVEKPTHFVALVSTFCENPASRVAVVARKPGITADYSLAVHAIEAMDQRAEKEVSNVLEAGTDSPVASPVRPRR